MSEKAIEREDGSAGVAAQVRVRATGVTRFVSLDDPAADDTADRIAPERQESGQLSLIDYGFGDSTYEVEFLVSDPQRIAWDDVCQWVADAAEVPVAQVSVLRFSGIQLADTEDEEDAA
jgi:hypothetical protein